MNFSGYSTIINSVYFVCFYFFYIFFYFIFNLKHCISFAKHQNESATGIHVYFLQFLFSGQCSRSSSLPDLTTTFIWPSYCQHLYIWWSELKYVTHTHRHIFYGIHAVEDLWSSLLKPLYLYETLEDMGTTDTISTLFYFILFF